MTCACCVMSAAGAERSRWEAMCDRYCGCRSDFAQLPWTSGSAMHRNIKAEPIKSFGASFS